MRTIFQESLILLVTRTPIDILYIILCQSAKLFETNIRNLKTHHFVLNVMTCYLLIEADNFCGKAR